MRIKEFLEKNIAQFKPLSFSSWLKKNWRLLLIIYIFSLGVKVVYFLIHQPFAQDQARDITHIRSFLERGSYYIQLGPKASVGDFFLPPLYYYFQLFAQIIFGNATFAMTYFTMIVESLSPIFLYYFISRWFEKKWSIIVPFLYSLSVGVMMYGTIMWNPNLIPFFTLLFLIGMIEYIFAKSERWLFTSLVSFIIIAHLHFQWPVLLPPLLILLVFAFLRGKSPRRKLLVAGVFGLISILPFIHYETLHNYENLRAIYSFATEHKLYFDRVNKLAYVTTYFPTFYERIIIGSNILPYFIFTVFFSAVLAVNLFESVSLWKKQKKVNPAGLLILVFFLMVVMLRVYKGDKNDYYLNIFVPFIFLFIGSLFQKVPKAAFAICLLLIALIASFYAKENRYNHYRGFEQAASLIKQKTGNQSFAFKPLNNELDLSFRFFLKENISPKAQSELTVYVCYKNDPCKSAQENVETETYHSDSFTILVSRRTIP